jgi:predicted adenylyl cyclase CyaB
MENIEIEITLKLEKPEKLLNWLKENAEFIEKRTQTDWYFDSPKESFFFKDKNGYIDAYKWFRVRKTDKENSVCFKNWYVDEKTDKSTHCDEIETQIADSKKMVEILSKLGFKKFNETKKERKSYKYGDYRFDCDKVKGLGFFVEVEFKGELDDTKKGTAKIFELLEKIGVKNFKTTKRGYQWMMLNPEKNHYEEIK